MFLQGFIHLSDGFSRIVAIHSDSLSQPGLGSPMDPMMVGINIFTPDECQQLSCMIVFNLEVDYNYSKKVMKYLARCDYFEHGTLHSGTSVLIDPWVTITPAIAQFLSTIFEQGRRM